MIINMSSGGGKGELGTPSVNSAGLVTVEVAKGGVLKEGESTTLQLSTQAAKTVTPSTSAQTAVAAGKYTTGAVTVAAMTTATQATPSITVSSAGLITASATQTAGYVAAGTKSATKQLSTQAAKTVTPSTSAQTAVSAGKYTTGAVTVAAIPSTYKRVATGSFTGAGTNTVTISGLSFKPSGVMLTISETKNISSTTVSQYTDNEKADWSNSCFIVGCFHTSSNTAAIGASYRDSNNLSSIFSMSATTSSVTLTLTEGGSSNLEYPCFAINTVYYYTLIE